MNVFDAAWHAIQATVTLIWGYLAAHPPLTACIAVLIIALVVALAITDTRTTPPQNKGDDPR